MNWLLISTLGFAAWVTVLLFFVAVCRAAALGDKAATAPVTAWGCSGSPTPGADDAVLDQRAFRWRRSATPSGRCHASGVRLASGGFAPAHTVHFPRNRPPAIQFRHISA
jgi:hypothetical protein